MLKPLLITAASLFTAAAGAGCAGGSPSPTACGPLSSVVTDAVPAHLRLSDLGQVSKVTADQPKVTVGLRANGTVDDRAEAVRGHFDKLGWTVVGYDNEGFEAEVFMVRGSDTGVAQVRDSHCPGLVDLDITVVTG